MNNHSLINFLSGKFLIRRNGLSRPIITVVVMWRIAILSGFLFLSAYLFGFDFKELAKNVFTGFGVTFWAFFSALNQEFVSKYQHLSVALDNAGKDEDVTLPVNESELDFLELCLVYRLEKHVMFKGKFNEVLARTHNMLIEFPEYTSQQLARYYPPIETILRKSDTNRLLESFGKHQELVRLEADVKRLWSASSNIRKFSA